jgi:large subunit ribosomal protein L4e
MTSRPTVTIIGGDGKASDKSHPLPSVFRTPIRPDIVQYVQALELQSERAEI